MSSDRTPIHVAVASGVLAMTMMLTGCSLLPGSDDPQGGPTCGDQDWCYTEGDDHIDGSYDPLIASLYCTVTFVRQRMKNGKLTPGQLPTWADHTQRDGAPIVIDMATIPSPDFNKREQDLLLHLKELGIRFDLEELIACADKVTQRDIEATDGNRTAG